MLKFFTDKSVINDFLLVKIEDYIKMKSFRRWSEVLIDPGVYHLKTSKIYPWEGQIHIEEFMENLPKKHYFAFDYPCDMNIKYQDSFIIKSWLNAKKYAIYEHFIPVVQFGFSNFKEFKIMFDGYNKLDIASKIIGLGNMCRIHFLNDFMKNAIRYAFENCKHNRIHIYGLGLRIIPYAHRLSVINDIELSVDSTKWTRSHHTPGLRANTKAQRQEFFDEYLSHIKNLIGENK